MPESNCAAAQTHSPSHQFSWNLFCLRPPKASVCNYDSYAVSVSTFFGLGWMCILPSHRCLPSYLAALQIQFPVVVWWGFQSLDLIMCNAHSQVHGQQVCGLPWVNSFLPTMTQSNRVHNAGLAMTQSKAETDQPTNVNTLGV